MEGMLMNLNGTKVQVNEGCFSFGFIGRCGGCDKHCKILGACSLHTNDQCFDQFEFHPREDCGKRWWRKNPDEARKEFERCLREEKMDVLSSNPFWEIDCPIGNPLSRLADADERKRAYFNRVHMRAPLRMKAEIFFEAARRVRKLFSLA